MINALTQRRYIASWLAAALVAALGVWLRLPSMIHHDVAWSLYLTQEYLAGARIYVDLIEINPPLIYWLMSPGVLLSNLTGLTLSAAFKAYVFVLSGLSLAVCAPLIRRIQPERLRLALPVALAFMLAVLPRDNFGQREHLLIILGTPWFLLAALRLDGARVSAGATLVIAAMASLGFYLKPYFLLAPALVELLLLVRLGRKALFRPEQILLALAGAVYVGLVLLVTPEYLSRIVRYGVEVYQTGYGRTLLETASRPKLVLALGLATAGWSWIKRDSLHHAVPMVMAAAAIGFLGSYLVQAKGFAYQAYPMQATLFACVGALLAIGSVDSARGVPARLARIAVVTGFCIQIMIPLAVPAYNNPFALAWQEEIARRPGVQSVMVMSSMVSLGFPLVTEAQVKWASRFPCLWLTPGLKIRQAQEGESNPLLGEIDHYNRQAVYEDMQRFRPELVFVDVTKRKQYFGEIEFDYIEDFSHHPGFRELWANYEKVGNRLGYDIYERRSTLGGLQLKPPLY